MRNTPDHRYALDEIRRIFHADQLYLAALLELAYLEKSLAPDATFRFFFRRQLPGTQITDGVAFPDDYHALLHLYAFIEKCAKSIALFVSDVTPAQLNKMGHRLGAILERAQLPMNQLKRRLAPQAFKLLNELIQANYSSLRYLNRKQRITFDISSARDLRDFMAEAMFQIRASRAYSAERTRLLIERFHKRTPLIKGESPLSAEPPLTIDARDFDNIVNHRHVLRVQWDNNGRPIHQPDDSLSDREVQTILSSYQNNGEHYVLIEPMDQKTKKKLRELFTKASYTTVPFERTTLFIGSEFSE